MSTPSIQDATHVFLDFDGTVAISEGLEILAEVVAERLPAAEGRELAREIERLTELAMAGEASFGESLRQRLRLLAPTREDLDVTRARVAATLDETAGTTLERLRAAGLELAVISGGLRAVIEPIARDLGFASDRVHCNDLRFEGEGPGILLGENPLAENGGKAVVIRAAGPADTTVMVGDGATDLEVKTLGAARWFVAHVGLRRRTNVVAGADHVIESLSGLVEILT